MNLEQFNIFKKSPRFNKERYELGLIAEMEVLDTLREYFEDGTIFPLPEGDQFDFTGKDKKIEFKSRSVYRLTYEDTAIGIQKINKSRSMEGIEDHFYVFKYVNGLYYWKYDSKLILRQGKINGINHYFIDVRELIKIK